MKRVLFGLLFIVVGVILAVGQGVLWSFVLPPEWANAVSMFIGVILGSLLMCWWLHLSWFTPFFSKKRRTK